MATEKPGVNEILASFYDGGVYTPLFEGGGAVSAAFGTVSGQGAYAVCQSGAAMAAADVAVCRRAARMAAQTGNPVVTFYNSPGAKLEEGLQSLAAAKRLAASVAKLSGVVPQIAVITGVCGASSALAAACADVCVMAGDAELFLTPPALAPSPDADAGSAAAAVRAGVVSVVAENTADAVAKAARLVALLPANNLSEAPMFEYEAPGAAAGVLAGMGAVEAIADAGSAVELYAGFGGGLVTCLATVGGSVAGIAAACGPDTRLGDACAARAARFVRLCDAYSLPVVTVLNSGGFCGDDGAGMLRSAARLASTYADATCPKVLVLAGRSFGALYSAFGAADITVAVQGSVTAPAAPEAVVSVLYKKEIEAAENSIEEQTAACAKRYEAEEAGPAALLRAGLADMAAAPAEVRGRVEQALALLAGKRAQRMPKKHGNMPL